MNETREQRAAAARARMAEIAAKFIVRSSGEIGAMRDALTKLAAGDAAVLTEIRHIAHRMTGTGATLGFEQLSDCAATIEKLADAQAPGVVPAEFVLAQITGAVDSLARELAHLSTSKP